MFDRHNCVGRWRSIRSRRINEVHPQANHVWILPPSVLHEVHWRSEADLVTLHLEACFANKSAGQEITEVSIEPLAHYVRHAPIIGELCSLLRCQGRAHGTPNEPVISGLGVALATQLMAAHFARFRSADSVHRALTRSMLAEMRAYIEANLSQKLTLSQLARVVGLSPNYFGQLFRAATGFSPIRYILDQRVLRAREMLRLGHTTVAEVAQNVGFYDQHQMNRHFRRLLHNPPSAYLSSREKR